MARRPFNVPVISRELTDEINVRVVRRLGEQVLGSLVLTTPVGMPGTWLSVPPAGYTPGHARFSWKVKLNGFDSADVPGQDPGGARTIADGQQVMRASKLKDTINIFNNAPYIGRLNNGWSRQAAAGYVDRAIRSGIASAGTGTIVL